MREKAFQFIIREVIITAFNGGESKIQKKEGAYEMV
jgi:hypothetical protein